MNQSDIHILIVDDTRANLRLLSTILGEAGYTVRPVPDGRLALSAARARPPQLILLDIMMPDLDGYAVCERLKADDRTADIPVIFVSAKSQTLDKVRAFSLGGVDYITKPFQPAEVLARVETHLRIRGLQLALAEKNQDLVGAKNFLPQQPSQGAIFSFCIRARTAKSHSRVSLATADRRQILLEPDQPHYRILVVDDKWDNRQLLVRTLRPYGFEVREAENGQEAVAVWAQWQPELIWMDLRMPVMEELIPEIHRHDPELARAVARMADEFDYIKLSKLIETQ